jgi:hypothetical protein
MPLRTVTEMGQRLSANFGHLRSAMGDFPQPGTGPARRSASGSMFPDRAGTEGQGLRAVERDRLDESALMCGILVFWRASQEQSELN